MRKKVIDNREEILDVATRLFGRRGYAGTTIAEITRACGISKAALYWHFENKSDLLGAVVDRIKTEYLDRFISEGMEAGPRSIDRIWWTFKFIARFGLEHADLVHCLRSLSLELAPSEDRNVNAFFEILEEQRKFFVSLLEAGQTDGYIRTDFDPKLLAAIILAVHDGIFLQWTVFKKLLDGRDLVWAYRQVLLAGISPSAKTIPPFRKTKKKSPKKTIKKTRASSTIANAADVPDGMRERSGE